MSPHGVPGLRVLEVLFAAGDDLVDDDRTDSLAVWIDAKFASLPPRTRDELEPVVKVLFHYRIQVDQRDLDFGQQLGSVLVRRQPQRPVHVEGVRSGRGTPRIEDAPQPWNEIGAAGARLADHHCMAVRKQIHLGVTTEAQQANPNHTHVAAPPRLG